jgi:hypothetical protein
MPRRAHLLVPLLRALALLLATALLVPGCGDREDPKPADPSSRPAPPTHEMENPNANAGPTAIRLEDVSEASGITATNHSGRDGVKEFLLEAVGTGPSWLDYDGDGLLDLYVPDGDVFQNYVLDYAMDPETGKRVARLVPKQPRPEPHRNQLWHNLGNGRFEDVAEKAGVADESWSFGSTAFDFDGDGRTDIFVANFGPNRLYHNNGDGTFTDVAPAVGLTGPPGTWSTCGAVADYDGDGRLDIFVTAYADPAYEVERQRSDRGLPPNTPVESIGGRSCRWKTIRAYCGPLGLVAQHDRLYHQEADGTFRDVTEEVSLLPRDPKYAFTAIFHDVNDDGLPDIYVANDSVENFLWIQERDEHGRPRFRERADAMGVKYGGNLNGQASMGAALADVNQDGIFDLFVTNFSHDYNNLFVGHRAEGAGGDTYFTDRGLQLMGQAVYFDLSWGCGWIDFDDDADADLYIANGHVYKEIDLFEKTGTQYDQYNALFECLDAKNMTYRELGPKAYVPPGVDPKDLDAGPGLAVKKCSRGAAFGDYDNDGFMDVFVQNMNSTPTLIRNATPPSASRNWAKFVLRQPGKNREALGGSIAVTAGGRTQRFPVLRVSSFLGCDDPRIHVGLGAATTCDVKVAWPPTGEPGGERTTTEFHGLQAGRLWLLDRASGEAEALPLPKVTVAR